MCALCGPCCLQARQGNTLHVHSQCSPPGVVVVVVVSGLVALHLSEF